MLRAAGNIFKKNLYRTMFPRVALHVTGTNVPHSGTKNKMVPMKIEIKLFASLRVERFSTEVREYSTAMGIGQVVGDLGISEKEIGVVLLNGQHASLKDSLKDGDTLSLLPLVGGG